MDIKFESFAELVHRLGRPPRDVTAAQIFASWLAGLQRPLPPHTGKRLFRLLFPHEGARRRYDLKETRLAAEVERILGVTDLARWDQVVLGSAGARDGGGTGCLGAEVERAVRSRASGSTSAMAGKTATPKARETAPHSSLTLSDLDRLLDRLASSHWSQLSQPTSPAGNREQTLARLYRDVGLTPWALSVLTQIILRDLRPLLCPLPQLAIRNPTAMLRVPTTKAPDQLTLYTAMRCWDRRMPRLYREKGNLDWCLDKLEGDGGVSPGPLIGVNIQGRSVEDAMRPFPRGAWAETKHDGYRMQIHVDATVSVEPTIRIFSKSKRNSTTDRINTHSIILAALGFAPRSKPHHPALTVAQRRPVSTVILEAEMVPYNDAPREGGRGPGIEEFWWLERVVHNTRGARHLCLVFFDILYLDGQSMLDETYDMRRRKLEATVGTIPGFGLVLKAPNSTYNGKTPWVKLKKDYIPGMGDCIDLVLIGAGWDADRARELRVDTSVFTTFYLGVLTNHAAVQTRREAPHFEVLFPVSYGATRAQLEVYNENIRLGRWRTKPFDRDDPFKRRALGLSYTYKMRGAPSVLFEQPTCAEVMGAGFQRLDKTYELRWPRLMKIYDLKDRPWTDALKARDYMKVVHRSLGYHVDPHADANAQDSLDVLWRTTSTVAITDIPDSPLTPPRTRSEPQLCTSPLRPSQIKTSPNSPFKLSPTSPRVGARQNSSARLAAPLRRAADASAPRLVVQRPSCTLAHHRLRKVLRAKPLSLRSRLRQAKSRVIAARA